MKTILTKESNGINIVIGFGHCSMDPVATRKKVEPLLANTEIYSAISAKADEIRGIVVSAEEAMKKSRQCLMKNDQVGAATHHQEFLDFYPIHKAKEQELGLILPDLEKKRFELYEQEAIYFEPKKGEVLVSLEAFTFIKDEVQGLAKNECLKFTQSQTGTTVTEKIPNFAGVSYWIKNGSLWESKAISQVNVVIPTAGIIQENLTDVQKEEIELQLNTERISKLTVEEKQVEYDNLISLLGDQAVELETKLKIQKDPDPLGASQAWYESEVSKANSLYGF